MNEEGLEKIQDHTLDWVSEWLNHDDGIKRLRNKLALMDSGKIITTNQSRIKITI